MKDQRLPPGQKPIKKILRWYKDHPGITDKMPKLDLRTWRLKITGEVKIPVILTWNELMKFPKTETIIDFHCVEGWSVLNCRWIGIEFRRIVETVKPNKKAKYVTFECADGYSTSLTLKELLDENAILAYKLYDRILEKELGYPLRLIIPNRYAYKNAMWLTEIRFTEKMEIGYWEKRGYSYTADVWKNDRYQR